VAQKIGLKQKYFHWVDYEEDSVSNYGDEYKYGRERRKKKRGRGKSETRSLREKKRK
jgi:hypothetical protein